LVLSREPWPLGGCNIRADLRIAAGSMTVEDHERLLRGNKRGSNFSYHPFVHPDAVRLTNYGNGTAYDIQFKGTHCRPRVWVGDAFKHPMEGQLVEVGPPMWNDTLSALGPGESGTVMVMTNSDPDHEIPSLILSCPGWLGAVWAAVSGSTCCPVPRVPRWDGRVKVATSSKISRAESIVSFITVSLNFVDRDTLHASPLYGSPDVLERERA
jgi:hypothetical protein